MVTRETQTKMTTRHHLAPTRRVIIEKRKKITNLEEAVEKLKPSYVAYRDGKRRGRPGKQFGGSPESSTQRPRVTQQIRSEGQTPVEWEAGIPTNPCTQTFTAKKFTAARTGKEPRIPQQLSG